MKIQFVIHHHLGPDAGAPGVTLELARHLTQIGHGVETLSFDQLPHWMGERQRMVVFPFVTAHIALRRDFQHRFDVVDASTGDTWLWGLLARSRRHAALVTRSHGLEHRYDLAKREEAARGGLQLSPKYGLYHGGWRLHEVALSLRFSDMVIVPNRGDAAYCVDQLGFEPGKVRVIHHGLPDAFIGLPEPQPWSPAVEPLRIALIGRYLPMKGSRYATVAVSRLLASHQEVEVTFLGTGISSAGLLRQFDSRLHERLSVVTDYANQDLARLLSGHHILLFPTLSEGFPLGLIEGMACGLAPVVADAAGAVEAVTDGRDSLVIPRADADAMERALVRLATTPALLENIRRAAYATAQRFTWSNATRQTVDAYNEAIASRSESAHS